MTHLKLLLIVGVWLVLAACTPPTPPPSPTPWPTATELSAATAAPTTTATATSRPPPSATPTRRPPLLPTETPSVTTITVWENLPDPQSRQLAEDVQAFQTAFPQYAIELARFDNPDSFTRPLASGETEFDVVLASPVLLGALWNSTQIAPMADFFPPSFMDGFAAATLSGATQNEQVWGLPETVGFHLLLFYNRALVDSPPADIDALEDTVRSLTGGSQGELGLNSYDPLWLVPWLGPYGGWLTDDSGQPTLDSPAMVEALTLYAAWHNPEEGIAPVSLYDDMLGQFRAGDIAMMINGDWAIAELSDARDIEWGIALLPGLTQADESRSAAPLVLGKYWAISRSTEGERALAAAAFLEAMTQPERQLAWAAKFGTLPTRRQALNDPLIVNDPLRRTNAAQMRAGRSLPLGVNPNIVLDAMRAPLRGLLDGDLTPTEAAAQMQANLPR